MTRPRNKAKRELRQPRVTDLSAAGSAGLGEPKLGRTYDGSGSRMQKIPENHHTQTLYAKRCLKKIAARWDARADTWDSSLQQPGCHVNQDEGYLRFLRESRAVIQQRREFCATQGVIDVGCGTGLVLADVASWFAWGIGVDISEQMIQLARRKHIARARFMVGDAFELLKICQTAGVILSRGVLLSHYGYDQGATLLRSLRASLLPHGFLLVDFLNRRGRVHRYVPVGKTFFDADEICEMARGAGFGATTIIGKMERRVLLLMAEVNN